MVLLATPVKSASIRDEPECLPNPPCLPPVSRTPRPGDATLSVTKAARVLGVHPNTVRAWSEAGRLRYFRINERGDRRYRLNDLQRFLAAAESGAMSPTMDMAPIARTLRRDASSGAPTLSESPAGLELLADLAEVASFPSGLDPALDEACRRIRLATGAALVGIWERRPGGLVPRATDVEGPGITATRGVAPGRNLFSLALESPEPIHARPGVAGPAPVLGHGHRRARRPHPRRRGAVGHPRPRRGDAARPGRRDAARRRDRPHARRARPGRQRHRAGHGASPPVRGAPARRDGPRLAARRG